ncbi:Exocyst complex component 7 [Lobulomyces angularis]|nr:Exocyst complex component 7 [Lobulomyces angularis]
MEEVFIYEQSIDKSKKICSKMVNLLESFDDTLAVLETTILPIHKTTKIQTNLYNNLLLSLTNIDKLIGFFDTVPLSIAINKGPDINDLSPFLSHVKSSSEALQYLSKTKFKAADKSIAQFKELLLKATHQLDEVFKFKLMTACSNETSQDLVIPDQTVQSLQVFTNQLNSSTQLLAECNVDFNKKPLLAGNTSSGNGLAEEQLGHLQPQGPLHIRTYVEIRSHHLLTLCPQLFEKYAPIHNNSVGGYEKGSSTFITYSRNLFKVMKNERELIQKLFLKGQALQAYQQSIVLLVDKYIENTEVLMGKFRRSLSFDGWSVEKIDSLFHLLDMLECITALIKDHDGLLVYSGAKGTDITDTSTTIKVAIISFFKNFFEEVKGDTSKISLLSVDGTVHEITSKAFNTCRRLLDYNKIIDQILSDNWGAMNGFPMQNFQSFLMEILDNLLINLEQRSKLYSTKLKQPTLGIMFLLNNYQYIHKIFFKEKILADTFGKDAIDNVEKLLKAQRDAYLNSWKPLYDHLFDNTYVKSGQLAKTLNKSEREVVKEKFKGFNADFEEFYRQQKNWAVPDQDLRNYLLKEIKAVLLVLYQRFYDRYQVIEFSKTPSKYCKYDKTSLEDALDKFFENK